MTVDSIATKILYRQGDHGRGSGTGKTSRSFLENGSCRPLDDWRCKRAIIKRTTTQDRNPNRSCGNSPNQVMIDDQGSMKPPGGDATGTSSAQDQLGRKPLTDFLPQTRPAILQEEKGKLETEWGKRRALKPDKNGTILRDKLAERGCPARGGKQ